MAKIIKAKRTQFYILNQLLAKIPKQSYEEGSMKIANFFRAVKKVLRKTLDEIAELQKKKDEKLEDEKKRFQELNTQLNDLEKITTKTAKETEQMADLRDQIKKNEEKAAEKVKAETKRLSELEKEMNSGEVEARFDNEDFLFVEAVFKKNPSLFQPENKEVFDLETMDSVYSMLENAFTPKEE